MKSRIARTVDRAAERGNSPCFRVHGAGRCSNTMDRFVQTNKREVLFAI
jgi:hypothetical protein